MDIIKNYFPDLSENSISILNELASFYSDLNKKVNLISRKDIVNFNERHICHSLAIYKYVTFENGTKIMDIGTGGGFPGIPLAIVNPNSEFLLVDSIEKKINCVKEVVKNFNLKNVQVLNSRAEKINSSYDFITGRAITRLPDFVNFCKNKIKQNGFNKIPNGILYLKGGEFESEIEVIKMKHKIIPLSKYYTEEFFETKSLVHLYYK